MEPIEYNPACFMCRKLAGRELAGVKEDSICVGHLRDEVAFLRQRLARLVEAAEAIDPAINNLNNARDDISLAKKVVALNALFNASDRLTEAIAAAKEVQGGNLSDCGCYIADGGDRCWCPSCLDPPKDEYRRLMDELDEKMADLERENAKLKEKLEQHERI